jgi:hypothetical protein
MTALARLSVPDWHMAPGLKRLARRVGARPAIAPKWPCLQLEQASVDGPRHLETAFPGLPGVLPCEPPHNAPGLGFALDDDLARGQPEAFLSGTCWLNLRPEGSMHLSLRPEWAQKVLDRGWATIHPFARYMAGAVPPQSLIVFAPRDRHELVVVLRIATAAHGYAMGRIGDLILPDTRW